MLIIIQGGSQFVDIVESWMKTLECFGKEVHQSVGAFGIQDGKVSEKTISNCPNISLAHVEYSCLDGAAMIESLDSHEGRRLNENFTLVTVLRDPIERIGSQAFYGPRNTFGVREINHAVDELCSTSSKRVKRLDDARHIIKTNPKNEVTDFLRTCSERAVSETLAKIRTNSSMWHAWFQGDVGFGDSYMPNYYIKRLSALPMWSRERRKFDSSIGCLKNITDNLHGECEKNNYLVMKELLASCECGSPRVHDIFNPAYALGISKELLDEHFVVLVLEHIKSHPEYFAEQLSQVLKQTPEEVDKVLQYPLARQNSGMVHVESSYRELMPAEIVTHLEEENKEDILLYNHIKEKQLKEMRRWKHRMLRHNTSPTGS